MPLPPGSLRASTAAATTATPSAPGAIAATTARRFAALSFNHRVFISGAPLSDADVSHLFIHSLGRALGRIIVSTGHW